MSDLVRAALLHPAGLRDRCAFRIEEAARAGDFATLVQELNTLIKKADRYERIRMRDRLDLPQNMREIVHALTPGNLIDPKISAKLLNNPDRQIRLLAQIALAPVEQTPPTRLPLTSKISTTVKKIFRRNA